MLRRYPFIYFPKFMIYGYLVSSRKRDVDDVHYCDAAPVADGSLASSSAALNNDWRHAGKYGPNKIDMRAERAARAHGPGAPCLNLVDFAALHESVHGPSRHFAAMR
jgi:hypothetical protein